MPAKKQTSAKKAPKAKATNTMGMIAKPSNPSVKLTALEEPTITSTDNTINQGPSIRNHDLT